MPLPKEAVFGLILHHYVGGDELQIPSHASLDFCLLTLVEIRLFFESHDQLIWSLVRTRDPSTVSLTTADQVVLTSIQAEGLGNLSTYKTIIFIGDTILD